MAAQLIVELYVNPASRNMRSLNERINRLQERAPRAESHPGLPTTLGNEGTSRVLADGVARGMRPSNGPDRRNGCSVG